MPSYSHSVKYFNTFDSTFCSTNSAENQTVYSDCATLGVSCKVYYNTGLTVPVTGYDFIKFGGVVHEMNFDTGEINLATEVQCTIPDVKIYRISVPGGQTSYVDWTECEGWPGPKQLVYDRMRSIDVSAVENSVSASSVATITEVGSCNPYPSCQCTYYGSTSTTTTTIPPIDFILTPYCTGSGVNGTGTINVNTFSGGNGTYQSVGIGSTPGNAFAATPINLSGASSYEFTGLFNGLYYVVLRDGIGDYKINSAFVDCINVTSTTSTTSTSTSTTSTTSTTTAALVCTYNGGSAVITYTTTTTSTTSTSTTTTEAPTTTSTTTVAPTTTTTTTAAPSSYEYLGRTNVDAGNSLDACTTYLTIRPYRSTKSSLSLIEVGDIIYDTYPSTPTNGGNNWIALKLNGIGDAYSFQINSSGQVIAVGGNCNATTTTTTTTAPSTVDIYISTILSLDIGITGMRINGVSVTYAGGSNFPLAPGDNGSFTSTQTGVQDVEIDYTTSIPGQHIIFTDSGLFQNCLATNGTGGTMSIIGADITAGTTVSVAAEDGGCP